MKEWLTVIALHAVTIIHAMALLIVVFGTLQAFIRSVHAMFNPSPTGRHFHVSYIQYARWLVGGLTFQLAADVIETAFSPSWRSARSSHIGRKQRTRDLDGVSCRFRERSC